MVKTLPAMQENWIWSLHWEDHLEKGMATHSSILAWRIPGMGEPGGLPSMGSQTVGHDWSDLAAVSRFLNLCHVYCYLLFVYVILYITLYCLNILLNNFFPLCFGSFYFCVVLHFIDLCLYLCNFLSSYSLNLLRCSFFFFRIRQRGILVLCQGPRLWKQSANSWTTKEFPSLLLQLVSQM